MADENEERTVVRDGPHATEVLRVLGENEIQSEDSLRSIAEKAAQIIERSVNPTAGTQTHSSDGLLYGLIQSGKTSIITVTAAMAVDNGFQCVVILTSDLDPLYGQTVDRVRKVLRGLNILEKRDWKKDAGRFRKQLHDPPFVVVCSKNASKLDTLLDAFKTAGVKDLSALIIDDEADQASLNTYTSKKSGDISRINRAITDFRSFFRVNTYLQVTASPQALFLQKPDHLYRPSFTVLSEPGADYVGGEHFFGAESNLLREVDLEEVDMLRATHQPSPTGRVPAGLRKALYTFLVAATVKIMQNPSEGYAFLCHVSVNTKDHAYIVALIDRFKEETLNFLQNPSSEQCKRIVNELTSAYEDLSETEPALPNFEQVLDKIRFYLHGANVKLVNASSNEEIKLDAVYNVFVGGNKLGRGVTIKNLLISYYGRNPKRPNSDTVLQHARMYGYRNNHLGLTRLFLPKELAGRFRVIHQMESALRELVGKYPDGKFEGLYISPPLRATRPNVLDPNSIGMYVAGRSYNPPYPARTPDMREKTEWLDAKLRTFDGQSRAVDVNIDFVIELLEKCVPDPRFETELWDMKTIKAALKMKSLFGDRAYLVVRRDRDLAQARRETQGILSGGEEALARKDAPTLFMYRQNAVPHKREIEVWWPQLRFREGNYVLAFSFDR